MNSLTSRQPHIATELLEPNTSSAAGRSSNFRNTGAGVGQSRARVRRSSCVSFTLVQCACAYVTIAELQTLNQSTRKIIIVLLQSDQRKHFVVNIVNGEKKNVTILEKRSKFSGRETFLHHIKKKKRQATKLWTVFPFWKKDISEGTHSRGCAHRSSVALDRTRSTSTTTSQGPCVYAGFSAKNRQHYIIPSTTATTSSKHTKPQLGTRVNRRRRFCGVRALVRRTTVCPAVVGRNLNHSRNIHTRTRKQQQ